MKKIAITYIMVAALTPTAIFAEGGDITIYKKFIDFQWSIIGTLGVVLVSVLIFIFKNVWGDIKELKKTTGKMNNRLASIEAVLPILRGKILGVSDSPMKLTQEGEKVLNGSGCRQYLEDNKENLLKQFDNIKIPFDIEEKARNIIRNSREDMDSYINKDFMHNEGKSFDDVIFVLGIELRDMVLHAKESNNQHSG